jgi:hypothetical protein
LRNCYELTYITQPQFAITSAFYFNLYSGGWSQLSPLSTVATTGLLYQPRMIGDGDCGEFGGIIGRGNRSTRRKPASMSLRPPQTPHSARTRTRTAAVGSQRLTAWATTRPNYVCLITVYEGSPHLILRKDIDSATFTCRVTGLMPCFNPQQ